jgi:hypothetical protein
MGNMGLPLSNVLISDFTGILRYAPVGIAAPRCARYVLLEDVWITGGLSTGSQPSGGPISVSARCALDASTYKYLPGKDRIKWIVVHLDDAIIFW